MQFHWKTVGHEPVKRYFERLITQGMVPSHAFLFAGPEGIGKQTLMHDLAAAWLCIDPLTRPCGRCSPCHARIKQINPDLMLLSLPEGASRIPVESIQALLESLSITSFFNHYRVVLIPHISLLSPSAANALLKSLEEPPTATLFFASTSHLSQTLPTIVSRCSLMVLSPPPPEMLSSLMAGHITDDAPSTRFWISFAQGKMGVLLQLIKDPTLWPKTVSTAQARAQALTGSLTEKMVLFKEKDQEIISALIELFHDYFLEGLGLPEKMKYRFLEPTFSSSPVHPRRLVRALTEALGSLLRKEQMNTSLALTNLLTHL